MFANASIISNYMEGDEGYCRSFDFNLTTTSLADDVSDLEGNVGTVVKLSEVRQEFKGAILEAEYDFYYLGILTGEYLDETVDAERQSFSFENEGSLFEDDGITKKEIIDVLEGYADDYLREFIDAANEERAKSVDDYVANEAPQYKPLLEHIPQLYEKVKYGADSESVEDVLHDAKRNLEREMKKKTDELLNMTDNEVLSSDEYIQEFKDQIKLVNDINKSTLAEYVARRKAVLNIFEKSLQYLRTGQYENESYLHELVFPMQATDRDVTYETHNLWLIDERLTYSTYLASDLSLGKAAGKKRPDILSLQDPQDPVLIADEENSGREFNAVSIFELKKPMKDDYTDEKNPMNQLLTYVEKLKYARIRRLEFHRWQNRVFTPHAFTGET